MVLNFKNYSLLDNFFQDYEIPPLIVEIDFAIEKLISFLQLTEGKSLTTQDLAFFSSKFQYDNALLRKGGNQTLFNAKIPLNYANDHENLSSICIKFFNEKIRPEAIIQFIASFLYQQNQNLIFEIELEDKMIIMKPTNLFYFSIHDFKLGKINREVSILVQENIDSNLRSKDYLTRKELSTFTKLLAKKGLVFDSYESNWKIVKIEKGATKEIFYCSYLDLFLVINYDLIKNFITKTLVQLNK